MYGEIERVCSYELPEEEKIVDGYKVGRFEYHFIKDTFNKLGYKAKINTHTTSYIN